MCAYLRCDFRATMVEVAAADYILWKVLSLKAAEA